MVDFGCRQILPTYFLANCSDHKLAIAKANYDHWPLAGYHVRTARGIVNYILSQLLESTHAGPVILFVYRPGVGFRSGPYFGCVLNLYLA